MELLIIPNWHRVLGSLYYAIRARSYAYTKLTSVLTLVHTDSSAIVMDGTGNTLDALSKTVGINLNELRDKYKGIAQAEQAKAAAGRDDSKEQKISQKDLERLDNYRICKTCLGKGTVKTIYNHMVMERDCEECDGEAVLDKRTQDLLSQIS